MAETFPSTNALDLPFTEAIKFFQGKVNLPTERWTDLWQGQHSRAFVVAGAMRGDLLADIQTAVLKGLEKGTTLAEFSKDFDAILDRTGWQPRGGRAWRAGTIFRTNLSTAYASGHFARMTDKDVLQARPIWRYVASSAAEPRPEHMQWYGLALPYDHPFWRTHYPPNGWGCECSVVSHSAAEVERLKAQGERIVETAPDDGTYDWKNPATGEVIQVPKGIDPGWAYNPGETAWGWEMSKEAKARWEASENKWERLTDGGWEKAGRPATIPQDQVKGQFGPEAKTIPECAKLIEDVLGQKERVYSFTAGDFRHDLVINADVLAGHIDLARAPYLPFLPETLEDPFEIWGSFERHTGNGKVELRVRVIKGLQMGKKPGMLVVTQANDGKLEGWTLMPTSRLSYLNRQRVGRLLWAR